MVILPVNWSLIHRDPCILFTGKPCGKNIGKLGCAEGFLLWVTQVPKASPPHGVALPPRGLIFSVTVGCDYVDDRRLLVPG